jgi:hypothetical protein
MEMVLIKQDSQEWNNMWDMVASHPLNVDYDNPSVLLHNGEAWQYMGSFKQDNRIIHEFRHRFHPRFQRSEYLTFRASDNITDDDIEKTLPIK